MKNVHKRVPIVLDIENSRVLEIHSTSATLLTVLAKFLCALQIMNISKHKIFRNK